jgi:hypothetical protein
VDVRRGGGMLRWHGAKWVVGLGRGLEGHRGPRQGAVHPTPRPSQPLSADTPHCRSEPEWAEWDVLGQDGGIICSEPGETRSQNSHKAHGRTKGGGGHGLLHLLRASGLEMSHLVWGERHGSMESGICMAGLTPVMDCC